MISIKQVIIINMQFNYFQVENFLVKKKNLQNSFHFSVKVSKFV